MKKTSLIIYKTLTNSFPALRLKLLSVVALVATSPFSHAATVADWRFENGAFNADSSGNGFTLNMSNGPTQVTPLPASGNGSDFLNPIPQTTQSNTGLIDTSTGFANAGSDASYALGNSYTIEFLFNRGTDTTGFMLAQWGSDAANRAFAFGLGDDSGNTVLRYARNASASNLTGFEIAANTDYYFGFTFDSGTATVYYEDLTNGGSLQSFSFDPTLTGSAGTINDSNADLIIGNLVTTSTSNQFSGFIDEVRLSDTSLSPSELLVTPIPEPGALSLISMALVTVYMTRRRRSLSES